MAAATLNQPALDVRSKEIETEYLSSLADLNVNSKPLINMLTILAEENLEHASVIVGAVEKHIAKVQPEVKLPILYLVDSIVKNVGKQYQSLFSQVIVNIFCSVFETVNERIREKMFSLRQTWNEVFPQSKLYSLDIKINSIDPGWPITASLKPKSPAIHVNPMFLKNNLPAEPNIDMQQQLRDKQRELLELQARKLELELLATKKRIEEQEKQLGRQTAAVSKELAPEGKRSQSVTTGASSTSKTTSSGAGTGGGRGRIITPNSAMVKLAKPRDPRLARQQAQLAAQMAAASTNSTPTVVTGGVTVRPSAAAVAATTTTATTTAPTGPVAFDPSGKPLSIRERLGRIPKRVDPRLKASQTVSNETVASSPKKSSSIGKSHDSSGKSHDSTSTGKTGKSSQHNRESGGKHRDEAKKKSSSAEKTKSKVSSSSTSSLEMSPSKASGTAGTTSATGGKKKSSSADKADKHSSPKHHRSNSSNSSSSSSKTQQNNSNSSGKSSSRSRTTSSRSPDPSTAERDIVKTSDENLMPLANESRDVDLRLLIPEKKLKLDRRPSAGVSPDEPGTNRNTTAASGNTSKHLSATNHIENHQSKSEHNLPPSPILSPTTSVSCPIRTSVCQCESLVRASHSSSSSGSSNAGSPCRSIHSMPSTLPWYTSLSLSSSARNYPLCRSKRTLLQLLLSSCVRTKLSSGVVQRCPRQTQFLQSRASWFAWWFCLF